MAVGGLSALVGSSSSRFDSNSKFEFDNGGPTGNSHGRNFRTACPNRLKFDNQPALCLVSVLPKLQLVDPLGSCRTVGCCCGSPQSAKKIQNSAPRTPCIRPRAGLRSCALGVCLSLGSLRGSHWVSPPQSVRLSRSWSSKMRPQFDANFPR